MSLLWRGGQSAGGSVRGDGGGAVGVLGVDCVGGVVDVGGGDVEKVVGLGRSGGWSTVPVQLPVGGLGVRCHDVGLIKWLKVG